MSELHSGMSPEAIEMFRADADAHISDLCREWTKEIVGTNCAFVDDDLRILAHLASKAVAAGLTDTLPESVKACLPSPPATQRTEQ